MAAKTSDPGPDHRSGLSLEMQEEQSLVLALGDQDGEAFRVLVSRHLGAVMATAMRMLNDAAEAEDVSQDVMLRLWRSGAEVEVGPGGIRPWLRRVAVNLCIDRLRVRKRVDVTDEVPEVEQEADQLTTLQAKDVSQRVDEALGGLPERQRQALILFHYEGMSQIEVASVMGISDEAVESLLARARRSLRQGLKNDWQALLADEA